MLQLSLCKRIQLIKISLWKKTLFFQKWMEWSNYQSLLRPGFRVIQVACLQDWLKNSLLQMNWRLGISTGSWLSGQELMWSVQATYLLEYNWETWNHYLSILWFLSKYPLPLSIIQTHVRWETQSVASQKQMPCYFFTGPCLAGIPLFSLL